MMTKWLNCIVTLFDNIGKIVGGTVAIIAVLSLYPPFANGLKYYYAKNFNPIGYTRYAVDKNYKPISGKGQLNLIKTSDRTYDGIEIGDKLQVVSQQNLRKSLDFNESALIVLQKGDCVVVLETNVKKNGTLDGWLKVATTSCSFFD